MCPLGASVIQSWPTCRCVFESKDGWVEVVRDLATMYHKRRNFAKARKAFTRYLDSVDSSVVGKDTLSMVGLAATAMGDIDDGLRHYNAAIRKDPEFKEAWLNMFQGLKECGRVCICPSSHPLGVLLPLLFLLPSHDSCVPTSFRMQQCRRSSAAPHVFSHHNLPIQRL